MDVSSIFSAPDFVRAVRGWLSSGGNPNAAHPVSGARLLHAAAEQQDLDTIDLLLDTGADVNARDSYGQTALHISVDSELDTQGREESSDSMPVTARLLQRGADPTLRDNRDRTPGDWARAYGTEAGERFEQLVLRASGAHRT
jgi:ankyrin repeat protein